MNKDNLKGYLKDYVEKVTEPASNRPFYKCPLCGSGTHGGRNSDGAFSINKDGLTWKCFSCGESGDLFNLIQKVEGLTPEESFRRAEALFSSGSKEERPRRKKRTSEPAETEPTADYSGYIAACRAKADKTDYFTKRGFSKATIERFSLGYDEHFNRRNIKQAAIIPYDKAGRYYIARNTADNAGHAERFYKPPTAEAGEEPIYNAAALYDGQPCFICEAPFDAISIMEAGGNAIAIGGTGDSKLLRKLALKPTENVLILSFDNDEAGQKISDKVATELKKLNINFIKGGYSLEAYPEGTKDANEMLVSNRAQLEADVAENIRAAIAVKEAEKEEYKKLTAAGRLDDFIAAINDDSKAFYIPTHFKQLDKVLDGGLYAGLYVIGAISSLGKTTLALQIADNIAKAGQDVIIVSMEMAASELMAKSISRITYMLDTSAGKKKAKTSRGISTGSLYDKYSEEEKALIGNAIQSYRAFGQHITILEGIGDVGAEEIKKAVERHKALTGVTPVLIIDYLQILAPYELKASDKQNTDKAVLELKRLSRDQQTPVIAISSFNRDNYTQPINMASFKESGAIEYGSDVLIGLQYEGMDYVEGESDTARQKRVRELVKDNERKAKNGDSIDLQLKVLKNRSGAKTSLKLIFKPWFNYFEEGKSEEDIIDEALKTDWQKFKGRI